jgi:hypothetical protein
MNLLSKSELREPEVKTRFATVNDAAFETFSHEKDAKMM